MGHPADGFGREDPGCVGGTGVGHRCARTRRARGGSADRDGCGISADPDDPAGLAEGVRGILRAPERLVTMSLRGRELARTYDRVNELHNFVQTIEEAGR